MIMDAQIIKTVHGVSPDPAVQLENTAENKEKLLNATGADVSAGGIHQKTGLHDPEKLDPFPEDPYKEEDVENSQD